MTRLTVLLLILMGLLLSACTAQAENATPTVSVPTPTTTTLPMEPSAEPTEEPTDANFPGKVKGKICYPSEWIPPMILYFQSTSNEVVVSQLIEENQNTYTIDLEPGTYVAYAWLQDGYTLAGSYSELVTCGLTVECLDHSLIPITVEAGETINDVDICDWYGGPGSVPLPPGVNTP
jgi:hypothetical protein